MCVGDRDRRREKEREREREREDPQTHPEEEKQTFGGKRTGEGKAEFRNSLMTQKVLM